MAGVYTPLQFAARLRDFPREARPLIKELMDEAGKEGEDLSKRLVPVRTGALRDSIDYRSTTNRGWNFLLKVEVGADYATFVEYGTSRMSPRPFIAPGVELATAEIETAIGLMVEEYL